MTDFEPFEMIVWRELTQQFTIMNGLRRCHELRSPNRP